MNYLLYMALPMAFGFWAQYRVKSAFKAGSEVPAASGMTGADVAQKILDYEGISNVGIEASHGHMSDHYDPKAKMLRLSPDVFGGRSLAALGVAAHEVGHAIQDAKAYKPLVFRNAVVPVASFGSSAFFYIIIAGAMLNMTGLTLLGIALFSVVVVFQLINLPVEFDASARAKTILFDRGFITSDERRTVSKVLTAAAMTYVAATVSAVATLMYYLVQFGIIGGSRD
ncbi:UNVERIFIED_CONTAM: hypothetical protein GTU68_004895 [Idotea baltica]|nr:hypothetical protein [Idotea baltica]